MMAAVLLENVPLAPDGGAVRVTLWLGIPTPAASVTSTVSGVVKAELIGALCVPPAVIATVAGTWVTGMLSVLLLTAVPELVCTGSPPPYALTL
jgi:hypothetical protein